MTTGKTIALTRRSFASKYLHLGLYCYSPCLPWSSLPFIHPSLSETYTLSRLNKKKKTDNLNRLITRNEIEPEIEKKNKLPANNSLGLDNPTGECYQTYKEELIPILFKLLKTLTRRVHSQTHSQRPPFPWYQKPDKDNKKRHKMENYRPVSLLLLFLSIF